MGMQYSEIQSVTFQPSCVKYTVLNTAGLHRSHFFFSIIAVIIFILVPVEMSFSHAWSTGAEIQYNWGSRWIASQAFPHDGVKNILEEIKQTDHNKSAIRRLVC